MYEWGKVEKVLGNKTGITSYPWTVCRGPLFHKPVTGQEFFFAVSYNKPALVSYSTFLSSTEI